MKMKDFMLSTRCSELTDSANLSEKGLPIVTTVNEYLEKSLSKVHGNVTHRMEHANIFVHKLQELR